MKQQLQFGDFGRNALHLCVDMQRLFAEATPWHMPWMERVLPKVTEIAGTFPEQTVFTRFIPVSRPGEGHGAWKRYYEKWDNMTLEKLGAEMIDLIPDLARFAPPAGVADKHVYGPWLGTDLHMRLQKRQIDTLIITGGELDVCVLATVAGAVDLGYRIILVEDALCSSSNETYDAMMNVYRKRYNMQIELVSAETILRDWRP